MSPRIRSLLIVLFSFAIIAILTASSITVPSQPASGTQAGHVTTGTQTFGGNKTFNGTNNTAPNQTYVPQGSGLLTSAQFPKAQAYMGASVEIVTSTWTKVSVTSEYFDTHNYLTGGTFTPLTAGKYLIETGAAFDSTSNAWLFSVYKNGTEHRRLGSFSGVNGMTGSCVVEANGTTDYFEIYCWHNHGVNRWLYSDPLYRTSFILLP